MNTKTTTIEVPTLPIVFDASERCDRCGAQAHSRVITSSPVPLLFCAHHRVEHDEYIRKSEFIVIDDADALERMNRANR
jgi:hypothetical protein